MNDLELLDALLAHEEMEMLGRTKHHKTTTDQGRKIFEHKRQTFSEVRGMIAELQSARRPGAGAYSRGANHFHEHGELLPVPTEDEVLASVARQLRADFVPGSKFYAALQRESDIAAVVHPCAVAPVV